MELPVQFVYIENGVEKTSVDENKRMNYIDQLNKNLNNWYIDARQREEAEKTILEHVARKKNKK